MEEDIKILEDLIFEMRTMGLTKQTLEYAHSLENLIKGYRELKKEYERVRTGRNWLSERISAQIATPELLDKILEEDYIPKSKIKEINDKITSEMKYLYVDTSTKDEGKYEAYMFIRNIIEELMGDK